VTIEGPDTGVQISIASQALPLPMTIESMGPMIELGPKMAVPEYRKLSGKVIEAAGKQAYELQYEGRGPDGPKLRFAQRVFINGGTMIVLSAAAPVAQWQKDEKAIVGTLDSFSFIEAKGGPGAKKAAPEALKE
jgi:hypothetical protein